MSSPVLESAACICTPYRGRDVRDADCPKLRSDIPRMTMHDALAAFEAIRSSTRAGEAAHGIATLAVQQIRAHGGDGVPAPAAPADQRTARPAREVVEGWALDELILVRDIDRVTAALEADRAARPSRDVQGEGPGGHHENCDVYQLAPDLGPSQKPCNCRPFLGAPECTGISAYWCPVHGDCNCPNRESMGHLDGEDCPLHSRDSTHAEAATAPLPEKEPPR